MTNEFMSGILGNAIRSARIEKHISQEELAEKVGITPTHIKHIESGHRKPSIDVLYKIVVELSLSLDNVFLPTKSEDTELYQRTVFLLSQCDEKQLKVVCATIEAMLMNKD